MELHDTLSALADFNYAISIDSLNSFAYFNRFMVNLDKGDTVAALSDLNTVIRLDPQNALCYFHRAEIKSKKGDLLGAVDDYNQVLVINPNNVYTYFNRGIVYYLLRKWKLAIDDYSKAIELNPEFVAAYYNRAIVWRQLGDLRKAKQDFEKALQINNEKNANRESSLDSTQLAKIITFKADFERGNVQVSQTFDEDITAFTNFQFSYLPHDSISTLKLSQSEIIPELNDAGENKILLVSYRQLSLSPDTLEKLLARYDTLTLTDQNRHLFLARAALKAMRQNYSAAIDDCDLIIRYYPDYLWAYFMRGTIRFKLINLIKTIKSQNLQYYSIGKSSTPKPADNQPENYNEVIADYQKCIALNPKFPYTYFNLANVEIEKNNFDRAIEYYTQAIDINPKFAEAYFNRGLTYIYLRKNAEGCRDLSKSGELGVGSAYPVIRKYCNN
jgi:tetratricopeptide (TPR) repeat protein